MVLLYPLSIVIFCQGIVRSAGFSQPMIQVKMALFNGSILIVLIVLIARCTILHG